MSSGLMTVIDKLGKIFYEVVVTCFKVLTQRLLKEIENFRRLNKKLKLEPLEYEAGVFSTQPLWDFHNCVGIVSAIDWSVFFLHRSVSRGVGFSCSILVHTHWNPAVA
jgi:hypothetical protein